MHGDPIKHGDVWRVRPLLYVVPNCGIKATMRKCGVCGGSGLKHVHRTFFERFNYLAIYECRDYSIEELISRRHTFHFGKYAPWPMCGTSRVTKLYGWDRIDRMVSGLPKTQKRGSS